MTRLIFPADTPPFPSLSLASPDRFVPFPRSFVWKDLSLGTGGEGKSGQKCSRALHDIQSGSITGWKSFLGSVIVVWIQQESRGHCLEPLSL